MREDNLDAPWTGGAAGHAYASTRAARRQSESGPMGKRSRLQATDIVIFEHEDSAAHETFTCASRS